MLKSTIAVLTLIVFLEIVSKSLLMLEKKRKKKKKLSFSFVFSLFNSRYKAIKIIVIIIYFLVRNTSVPKKSEKTKQCCDEIVVTTLKHINRNIYQLIDLHKNCSLSSFVIKFYCQSISFLGNEKWE